MATLKSLIALNLKRILAEKRVNQTELAKKLDVSFQTVNGLLNQRAGVSGAMISKVATILGVEESDLLAPPKIVEPMPGPAELARIAARETVELLRAENSAASANGPRREIAELAASMNEDQARAALRWIRIMMGLDRPSHMISQKKDAGEKGS